MLRNPAIPPLAVSSLPTLKILQEIENLRYKNLCILLINDCKYFEGYEFFI